MGESVLIEEALSEETASLKSLISSISKNATVSLLNEKYQIECESKNTIDEIIEKVLPLERIEEIVEDMSRIRECAQGIDHETFIELCRMYGLTDISFQEHIKVVITKCLIRLPDKLDRIRVVSAVNKEKQFEVLKGKVIEEEVELSKDHSTKVKSVLGDLLEKDRKYVVSLEHVKDEIVMTAHVEQRRKTITTISGESKISSISIYPATKAITKYNTKNNQLYLKCGPNKKLKEYILSTFGSVFFDDNNHFNGSHVSVYKLDPFKNEDFSIRIDEDMKEQVVSARITEETIRIPVEDDELVLNLKANDVEKALNTLSNQQIDLTSQLREKITIEILLRVTNDNEEEKTKKVKVTVTNDNKISFNPEYTEVVNMCLRKWGIKVGE